MAKKEIKKEAEEFMALEINELSFKQLCRLKYDTKQAQKFTLEKMISEKNKEFKQVLNLIQKEIDKKATKKIAGKKKLFKDLTRH